MSEKKQTSPSLERSWFQELKSEFGKITWPTRKKLGKETVVVLVIAILLGCIIAIVDGLLKSGLAYLW